MSGWNGLRYVGLLIVCACVGFVVQAFGAESGYHILRKIPVASGGEATWDYITVDYNKPRLFVAHETEVAVLDNGTGTLLASIPAQGAHAIVLVPEFKHGFITNGLNATVTMFDYDTLKKLADIPAGGLPDDMIYDPFSKRVFSFNTVGLNSTAINAADGKALGNIDLGAKPEQAAADGVGHVFVDLKDKNAVARIDTQKLTVDRRWIISGCDRPTTMDMDKKSHRLFVGCRDLMLYVLDSDDGRVITKLPVGDNVDSTAFDPESGLIFTSSEDGQIAVMHEDTPDSFRVVENVKTQEGSKTMTLNLRTHELYLPYGDVEKLPPILQPKTGGKVDQSGVRRRVVANSFGILVVGK
jgi:WD40 repeat protein